MQRFLRIGLCLIIIQCAACTNRHLTLNFTTTPTLNHDSQGQPLSVAVKLYQLKDKSSFQQLNFYQCWQLATTTHTHGIVAQQQIILLPNHQQKITWRKYQGAHYLAVVPMFHDPDDSHWRQIQLIPTNVIWFPGEMHFILADDHIYQENNSNDSK